MPHVRKPIPAGTIFNRWTVIEGSFITHIHGKARSVCRCLCICGKEKVVRDNALRSGKSLSCGCLQHEMLSKIAFRHGFHRTPLYKCWASMLARCRNPKNHAYSDYGGRGIGVCDEWLDFPSFKKWSDDNGYSIGMTIDREDNNGSYNPSNCRWISRRDNTNNRRNTIFLTAFGRTMPLSKWVEETGLLHATMMRRFKRGVPHDQIITSPSRKYKSSITK